MRTRITSIVLTLFLGVLISSCGDDPVKQKTEEELQFDKLNGTWVLDLTAGSVTVAGNDVSSEWTGFSLTIGGSAEAGTYSSSGADSREVWPSSGTWAFGSNVNTLVRNDGIEISVSVTDNSLLLQFDYTVAGGRLSGIEGTWIFKMAP